MDRTLAVAIAALVVATNAPAADAPKPKTPATIHFVVATLKDDTVTYELVNTTTVTESVTQEQIVNGKKKLVTVLVPRRMEQRITQSRAMSELKGTDASGKEIPQAELKKKLTAGAAVVMLSGPIDEKWRSFFKPETVILEPKN